MMESHSAGKPTHLDYLRAGLSVIPLLADGSKRSAVVWKPYQETLATESDCLEWTDAGTPSGLSEASYQAAWKSSTLMMQSLFLPWYQKTDLGIDPPEQSLPIVKSPNGWHVYFRCEQVCGNHKIASGTDNETLIETRGKGGYIIAPGSPLKPTQRAGSMSSDMAGQSPMACR